MNPTDQSYVGTIKNFNPDKGWGFIQCPQTEAFYGKDIFVMKSHLGGVIPNKGDQVQFSVNPAGTQGPEAMLGVQFMSKASQGGMNLRTAQVAATTAFAAAGSQYTGTVKNWNPVKGWGMITCTQAQKVYGKDTFFMKSGVVGGEVQVGASVSFNIQMGVKGPEGADVHVFGGGASMAHPNPFQAFTPLTFTSPGQLLQSPQPQAQKRAEVYFGTIKSFNEEKGWGHISCDGTYKLYGKDMFLMRSALSGATCRPGSQVMFGVHMGQKGPEATTVSVLPVGSWGSEEANGAAFNGTIKSYDAGKGFGFIHSDESRAIFQKDIFIHQNELGGLTPNVGDALQFCVTINQNGKPEASQLVFAGYAPTRQVFGAPLRAAPY